MTDNKENISRADHERTGPHRENEGVVLTPRCIALFSGGLDSVLAAKIVLDQGIEVVGVFFLTPFTEPPFWEENTQLLAERLAMQLGIELKKVDLGMEYMKVVESPHYGFGKNMNPCIDCKIMMLRKAKEIMKKEGASFVITGEVVGQRPMSQRRDALNIVERDSSLRDLLLRPLSALKLRHTLPERLGVVDRSRLLGISGRSRKIQLELARKYEIKDYMSPAGGCLLTDKAFSRRLKDLLENVPAYNLDDLRMLRVGRHFRIGPENKLVVARNRMENRRISMLKPSASCVLTPVDFAGPVAVLYGPATPEAVRTAALAIMRYGRPAKDEAKIKLSKEDGEEIIEGTIEPEAVYELEEKII